MTSITALEEKTEVQRGPHSKVTSQQGSFEISGEVRLGAGSSGPEGALSRRSAVNGCHASLTPGPGQVPAASVPVEACIFAWMWRGS